MHYSLTRTPTNTYGDSSTGFSNASRGDKQICSASGCAVGTVVASNVPVVLVSYGPNGWGARTINNTNLAPPTSPDERENTGLNPNAYVSRPPSQADAVAGEFDDLVVWISHPLLISRVCPAGGCP